MSADPFAFDRFFVEQLFRPIVNLYQVTPLAAGETPAGGPIAYVRQKRMAIKEDIRFFADEEETTELFRIKARRMLEIGGNYDVTTADGQRIGILQKVFGRSLFRSTWRILDEQENLLATGQERSLFLAISRRLIDYVPYVGGYIPIPYNFELNDPDGKRIGGMDRKFQIRDKYLLDLSDDHERRVDRRLAVALAVGLDTLQNR
ncbi:MAG: hypothetical protein QOG29_938 [Gaiellaceae bacterium]|jgi:uncharacterized protein YxjI|nr:hypothetical protein [Gaiellaceae bacterium]MDX6478351.1 hypothetical protein [Gaiellaceae bacterium]MDX6482801.1 hypothetical protein [Gaiellaceae bacterium]MDX6493178.1 hypothetical protein [Gaiellaceae bacterium]MDX6509524.1 hypothetical protein [Gaiellaceae bacterium]